VKLCGSGVREATGWRSSSKPGLNSADALAAAPAAAAALRPPVCSEGNGFKAMRIEETVVQRAKCFTRITRPVYNDSFPLLRSWPLGQSFLRIDESFLRRQ
jgi:hypothetical protein